MILFLQLKKITNWTRTQSILMTLKQKVIFIDWAFVPVALARS